MNKVKTKDITEEIVSDFNDRLSNSLKRAEFSVYYKNGGATISIITVIPKENDKVEDKIYSNEARILNRYSDSDVGIDFRVMPRYREPLKSFVPQSFKRYVAA